MLMSMLKRMSNGELNTSIIYSIISIISMSISMPNSMPNSMLNRAFNTLILNMNALIIEVGARTHTFQKKVEIDL